MESLIFGSLLMLRHKAREMPVCQSVCLYVCVCVCVCVCAVLTRDFQQYLVAGADICDALIASPKLRLSSIALLHVLHICQ